MIVWFYIFQWMLADALGMLAFTTMGTGMLMLCNVGQSAMSKHYLT